MNALFTCLFVSFTLALFAIEAWLAHKDKMLTVKQMQKHGISDGLPFTGHHAMWSDIFLITPLITAIWTHYRENWSFKQWLVIGSLSYIANSLLHFIYCQNKIPEVIAHDGKLTPMGWAHWVFMGNGITLISLFYLCTPNTDPVFLIFTTSLLMIHMPFGTLIILSLFKPSWWSPRPHKDPDAWVITIVCWTALIGRTWLLLK